MIANPMPVSIPAIVDAASLIPDAVLDVRYATANNFTGEAVYPFPAVYLRQPTAEKLAAAAAELRGKGYRLVIYDAYRPLAAQRRMWKAKPDPAYVADPAKGSSHNRAAAVDVGLADASGKALEMPSGFDEFGEKARHSFAAAAEPAKRRSELRAAMERAGFSPYEAEWWHYADPAGKEWPLLDFEFELFKPR